MGTLSTRRRRARGERASREIAAYALRKDRMRRTSFTMSWSTNGTTENEAPLPQGSVPTGKSVRITHSIAYKRPLTSRETRR